MKPSTFTFPFSMSPDSNASSSDTNCNAKLDNSTKAASNAFTTNANSNQYFPFKPNIGKYARGTGSSNAAFCAPVPIFSNAGTATSSAPSVTGSAFDTPLDNTANSILKNDQFFASVPVYKQPNDNASLPFITSTYSQQPTATCSQAIQQQKQQRQQKQQQQRITASPVQNAALGKWNASVPPPSQKEYR